MSSQHFSGNKSEFGLTYTPGTEVWLGQPAVLELTRPQLCLDPPIARPEEWTAAGQRTDCWTPGQRGSGDDRKMEVQTS